MVCDDSKEQHSNDFRRKLREADCHLCTTEPYLPWQQATEGCIWELKRGVSCQMLSTGFPKALWDHCLVLQALIRSCTSNDIYMTNGQVPETIMTGSTADISHIAEFARYNWVMFHDNTPTFLDEVLTLGRYLGLALDVGSALTANILKANGQFVAGSTLRHLNLTDQELADPVHSHLRSSFDQFITNCLGPNCSINDFPDPEDLTPDPAYYDDDGFMDDPNEGTVKIMQTPEAGDNYISAEVMLPKGGTMSRG